MSDEKQTVQATDESGGKTPREQAVEKLNEWAEFLEIDTESEHFAASRDALIMPLIKGRLDFDRETERFRYRLLKPIRHENSNQEIIEIREMSGERSKILDRFKDNESVQQANALLSRSCGISIAEAEQLINRDIRKINAVILGFFA